MKDSQFMSQAQQLRANYLRGWPCDYYKKHRYNIYSQNGEDGIIEKLFEDLNIKDGYLAEFGAWDGEHLSNTYNLFRNNPKYVPILIEGDEDRYEDLIRNLGWRHNAHLINKYVSADPADPQSLNNIFRDLELPGIDKNFQLLSIDVDGLDYEIWKTFDYCRPKIVIIEVNTDKSTVLGIDENQHTFVESYEHYSPETGASLATMIRLAKDKGYEIVTHCGNAIFVVQELYDKLKIDSNNITDIFDVWLHTWQHPMLKEVFPKAKQETDNDV